MLITVNIQLLEGDEFAQTPSEVAETVFSALGGDEGKDSCQATITQPAPPPGMIGTLPAPPSMEEPAPVEVPEE